MIAKVRDTIRLLAGEVGVGPAVFFGSVSSEEEEEIPSVSIKVCVQRSLSCTAKRSVLCREACSVHGIIGHCPEEPQHARDEGFKLACQDVIVVADVQESVQHV